MSKRDYFLEQRNRYRLALESLTPGGSEFFANIERCVSHVRERFESGDAAKKECVRLRRKWESRMQAFRDVCIRDMNGDGSTLECILCGQVGRGGEERHDCDCPMKEDVE